MARDGNHLSHQKAKDIANDYLRSEASPLTAVQARRDGRFGVWVIDTLDPARPDEPLDGGGLVVTDHGEVHPLGSAPGALEDLMMRLGRWPAPPGPPATDTDAEALLLLADEDPGEAAELAAWAAARKPWPGVLDSELAKPYFRDLLRFIDGERARGREIYPAQGAEFTAFHLTPFEAVKVVILGQDPYPNPDEATGLAFSVPRTRVRLPRSLVNIHAALRADGFTPPEHGDLTGWARQGVLLLNAALTVPRAASGGHLNAWRPFTDAVVRKLNIRPEPVVFLLWGVEAQKAVTRGLVDPGRNPVIASPHPASRGIYQRRFRSEQVFSKLNEALADLGHESIDWGAADDG